MIEFKVVQLDTIFPEKMVLRNMIWNRDNLRMNYPLGYPDCLFAVVIYIVFKNKGSESFRKASSFFQKSTAPIPHPMLTLTNIRWRDNLRVNDYRWKRGSKKKGAVSDPAI